MNLVRFLSSPQAHSLTSKSCGVFPPRQDLLKAEPFTDPFYTNLIQGLRPGCSFRSSSAWGKVESLLRYTLSRLWEAVTIEPQIDISTIVKKRTENLKGRVDQILESYRQQL